MSAPTLSGVPISDDEARELSRAAQMARTWTKNRDRLIREQRAKGAGYREIGRVVGLTHRAVSMIVEKGDSDESDVT